MLLARAQRGQLDVTCVGQKGEEEKEGAEDVLKFGNPCNGFDVHGMDAKQEGHEGRWPEPGSQPFEQEKNQNSIGNVKD